jgi:hypothetical protein
MELALGKPPLAKLPPMRIILNTVNNPPPALQDSPDGRVFTKVGLAVALCSLAVCLAVLLA